MQVNFTIMDFLGQIKIINIFLYGTQQDKLSMLMHVLLHNLLRFRKGC